MKPGERILAITGENGEEKSLAFLCALCGLGPWGSGNICPPRLQMRLCSCRCVPYIPPGTLRAAIGYPHSHDVYDAPTIDKAFHDVGLQDHLRPLYRYDRSIGSPSQLLVGKQMSPRLCRILLHRPKWVVSDGALVALIESNALIKSICERIIRYWRYRRERWR